MIDSGAGRVYANGGYVRLTRQEFAVFAAIWKAKQPLSRRLIIRSVYGLLPDCDTPHGNIVEVLMSKARKKLAPIGVTVENAGYNVGWRVVMV